MTSSTLRKRERTTANAPDAPSRRLLHTRTVVCEGYARSDGLYDIEARMQDISPDGTDLLFKHLAPGEAIHSMRITMTIDRDLVIRDIVAHTDAAPSAPCLDVAPFYAALKGIAIGRGFRHKVQALVGGTKGCTHLTELLGPLATTAMQTIFALRREAGTYRRALESGEGAMPRPFVVDTCHAYRADGEAVKIIWPEHRRG